MTYSYDSAEHGIGRLAQIIDTSGDTAWQYDLQGHTTARIQTIQLDGHLTQLTTRYNYNGAGQLSEITYPSGMKVGYGYSKGTIRAITINGQPLLNAITYQPFGPVSGWTWSNGNRSQRGYDLDGRLISQSLGSITRTLAYDANGNIAAITDPSNSHVFGYDELNRLTAANDATFNLAWTYDANGNRLSETEADIATTYSIDIASNRLMAVGDTAYQYDANGNLINDGEHSYQYNAQNRLISVDEGATGEYRYNAMGQRIFKKGVAVACDVNGDGTVDQTDLRMVNGKNGSNIDANGPGKGEAKGKGQQVACVATKIGAYANNGQGKGVENKAQSGSRQLVFSYDEYRLLGEYDIQGNSVQETVWLGNLPVATFQNNTVYYIHADHLGTPRVITDSSNTEVWRWDSDPFDVNEANEDPDGDGNVVSFNLRFPGQYYDSETGLHYNYFRDYDPATVRYIESDPIGLDGGLNSYAYVNANPIMFFDMYGLATQAEVNAAIETLRTNYPEAFPELPTSVGFDAINGLGMTDYSNNITMNSERFGDANACVREYDEYQFLQTLAHEMLHVNESWYSRILSNSFRMGNPLGYYHRQLDDRADAMVVQPVIDDYINRRGSRESCGCEQ